MARLFIKKDRHVIPNWRSFENTAKLGELNGSKGIQSVVSFKPDISDILEDWSEEENRSIGVAGDILGAAIVSNQQTNPEVIEIAKYVLENEEKAPRALINVSKGILAPPPNSTVNFDFDSVEILRDPSGVIMIYNRINALKKRLRDYPANAINWVEIGRLYAIIGQSEKAKRSVMNALFLAPENRFILRNMSRFFLHYGEEGIAFAHDALRKSDLVKHDPWILSTEIALASLRKRSSKFVKQGLEIIDSGSFHPFNTTELASSLATLELKQDNLKKSKKLFELSLKHPNDNSLAQAEWASQEEHNLIAINSNQLNLVNSFEAQARDFSEKGKWHQAIEYSKKWFLDLPFSKTAILFGNHIASRHLKDHKLAAEVGELGLFSHPHDGQLINNIMYSLCMINKLEEAELIFQKVDKSELSPKNVNGICLTATQGLLNYKKGNIDIARKLYQDAMEYAKAIGNKNLVARALANMTREEILLGKEDMSEVIPKLKEISKKFDDDDELKEDVTSVVDLYNRRRR